MSYASDTVIRVENLSKKYVLGHQQGGSRQYRSLRDSISEGAKSLGKRLLKPSKEMITPTREEFWALKDVSFEIKQGDRVGIIGRNGAGKSTLLKVLSRITEPTSGAIRIKGRVASLLEVGTGFHPELTGRENIFLNGAILGMSKVEIQRKFDEIVAFAEIEKFLDTPVKRYSSGMYVRLAFAVAAHLEPEILIVDEVLAVGDLNFQKKCLGKMESVSNEGRTVLFVSHNMAVIRKLCQYSILLNRGKIELQGDTAVVLKKYIEGGENLQSVYTIDRPRNENIPGYARKVTVEDEYGNPATAIPVGRPWQVRVDFTITRTIEHFVMGLGLSSTEEVPIRTSWSKPCSLNPGDYQIVFREETIIMGTGRYSLIIGLSSANHTFHYVEHAGVLEIAEYSEGIDLVAVSGVGFMLNPLTSEILNSKGKAVISLDAK
jgi:lipopolysaccharide transport system ATP-binding protein